MKRDPFVKEIYNAKFKKLPSGYKALSASELKEIKRNPMHSSLLPAQETGIRDSCALPYQLTVDGEISSDKKTFEMIFAAGNKLFGAQSAGAPFSVYAPGRYAAKEVSSIKYFEEVRTWNYAVRAGGKLEAQWPLKDFENSLYHLRVYGPNGFFREFIGDKSDPLIHITLEYERMKNSSQKFTGNIILLSQNFSDEDKTIEVSDNFYKNKKQFFVLHKRERKEIALDIKKSYNWYDISVKVKGNNLFEKRYAGRVETGEPGKSDPLMGKV